MAVTYLRWLKYYVNNRINEERAGQRKSAGFKIAGVIIVRTHLIHA